MAWVKMVGTIRVREVRGQEGRGHSRRATRAVIAPAAAQRAARGCACFNRFQYQARPVIAAISRTTQPNTPPGPSVGPNAW